MGRRRYLIIVTCVLLFATAFCAQGKPDFSGTWVLVSAPVPPGAGSGFGWGSEFKTTQDATSLRVDWIVAAQTSPTPWTEVFKLDGKENRNQPVPNPDTKAPAVVSKAVWEGSTIVIAYVLASAEGDTTIKQVLMIEGGNLVVSSKGIAPGVGSFSTTDMYKRK